MDDITASAGPPPLPRPRPATRPSGRRSTHARPLLGLKIAYAIPDSRHAAKGWIVHSEGFELYMRDRVGPRHADSEGAEIIKKMFSRVGMSGFERGIVDKLLPASPSNAEPWRVGESLAECFLEDYENARFPYPYRRDAKSERASHAGPDLAGYSLGSPGGADAMFLFGETKTSGEARHPPRGAGRLAGQLEDLCSQDIRRPLVLRLSFKAAEQSDPQLKALHRTSASSYLAGRFRLVGVLIRDLAADRKDLEAAFDRVKAASCA